MTLTWELQRLEGGGSLTTANLLQGDSSRESLGPGSLARLQGTSLSNVGAGTATGAPWRRSRSLSAPPLGFPASTPYKTKGRAGKGREWRFAASLFPIYKYPAPLLGVWVQRSYNTA